MSESKNVTPLDQAEAIANSAGIPLPQRNAQYQMLKSGESSFNSLSDFGKYLYTNSSWVNDFVQAYNRIAFVVITSRVWENPLSFLFKDQNYGYSIEEIYINTAKPLAYDPWGKGEEQWERVMPDVRNFMHLINVKTLIEQTIYDEGLRTAFSNEYEWNKFRDNLVANITDGLNQALYAAAVYLIALYLIETNGVVYDIPDYNANPTAATKALQIISNKMLFKTDEYNPAGVDNFCPKERQYLFVTPEFDATQSVDVLAYMFNIEKGELPQRKIMINNFWKHDYNVLGNIFVGGVPHIFSDDEIEILKNIPAFICGDDLLFFYKLFDRWGAPWNDKKLYWNYMHHWQGTMSYSPFAVGVALYTGTSKENTSIRNPYFSNSFTIGRDNLFYLLPAYEYGGFDNRVKVVGTVTGEGLVAKEGYPNWYQAVNIKGKTATITYASENENIEDLVITITVV